MRSLLASLAAVLVTAMWLAVSLPIIPGAHLAIVKSPPAVKAAEGYGSPSNDYELPFGFNAFAPSNARTTTETFISHADFIPARRCARCHPGAHTQWNESAHRNSFREPFYQANVKHLIGERGIAVTRHCESCHNPVALFSGALSANSKIARPFDDEGVTCSVCHSIEAATTEGIGSYVIAPPAMLVRANGERVREATDEEIMADLPSHYRAVRRELLKTPEFCAACHKAAVVPELNKRKWLRSFAIYDEWQQSAFSNETVQPLSRRERQSCQSCHMKQTGGIASHRWPGANTAIPAYYGWADQLTATTELLKSNIVSVDIFALRSESAGDCRVQAPLDEAGASVSTGETVSVDVVVANRGVGHSFPAELRDIFEAWLEFEAIDSTGRVLAHSGAVRSDGTLEWDAHAYRAVPIGNDGQPITRHDIWNTRVTALDRHIAPGRADLARFSFAVPRDAAAPIKLMARVNYRRFNRRFNDWVAREFRITAAPVTEMAGASITLSITAEREPGASRNLKSTGADFARWRVYGIALLDQQQYESAAGAFERALELVAKPSPEEASINIDLATALLKMERVGSSRSILERAERSLTRALQISNKNPRAMFYRALLNIKRFGYSEATTDLQSLARDYPRDRQVWAQLASIYLLQQRDDEARAAYERILGIDPDDTEAHIKLAGLYWRFQLLELAKREQDAFQARRSDTIAETLRRGFLRAHPELYITWPWREFGDNPIGSN